MYQVHNTLCWFTAIIRSDKDTLMYKGFPISFTFLSYTHIQIILCWCQVQFKTQYFKMLYILFCMSPFAPLNFGIKHLTL